MSKNVGFLDAARQETRPSVSKRCRVAVLLDELEGDLKAEVAAAVEDPSISCVAIARALAKWELTALGRPVRTNSIERHRRRDCLCR